MSLNSPRRTALNIFLLVAVLSTLEIYPIEAKEIHPSVSSEQKHTTYLKTRIVIQLNDPRDFEKFKARKPDYASIRGHAGKIVLLNCSRETTEVDLAKLRRIPGVRSAEWDILVYARQNDLFEKACTTRSSTTTAGNVEQLAKDIDLSRCGVPEKCPKSGMAKKWAQDRVNGDLMLTEMKNMPWPASGVSTAVVDSGFDTIGNRQNLATEQFQLKKATDDPYELSGDPVAHGTAVVGLVGAKDGVGLAPKAKLTVYKIEMQGIASTRGGDLKLGMQRACDDGNEIINMSWQIFNRKFFDQEKDFLDGLAQKGCLVVACAGNYYDKEPKINDETHDAVLRVASTAPLSGISLFSVTGELHAPGETVFSLRSSQLETNKDLLEDPQNNICGDDSLKMFSGTSFSSPLTAAIASQTLAVLKTGTLYSSMKSPERVRLLKRLMIASEHLGSIDALRAIRLASLWKNHKEKNPTVNQLKESLAKPPQAECANNLKRPDTSDCCKTAKWVTESRRQLALCQPPDLKNITSLVDFAQGHDSRELAVPALLALKENPPVPNGWHPEKASPESFKSDSLTRDIRYYALYTSATRVHIPEVETRLDQDAIQTLPKLKSLANKWGIGPREKLLVEIFDSGRLSPVFVRNLLTSPDTDGGLQAAVAFGTLMLFSPLDPSRPPVPLPAGKDVAIEAMRVIASSPKVNETAKGEMCTQIFLSTLPFKDRKELMLKVWNSPLSVEHRMGKLFVEALTNSLLYQSNASSPQFKSPDQNEVFEMLKALIATPQMAREFVTRLGYDSSKLGLKSSQERELLTKVLSTGVGDKKDKDRLKARLRALK